MTKLIRYKAVSSVMIFVIVMLATSTFYCESDAKEFPSMKAAVPAYLSTPVLKASKPDSVFSSAHVSHDTDQCDSCRYCACHAPLPRHFSGVDFSPEATIPIFSEKTQILHEVYLTRFVPPQNMA